MRIAINTVPHGEQRYNTVGDWQLLRAAGRKEKTLSIKVSVMKDWRYEALVAVHELCEALMCAHSGVTPQQVDMFDFAFQGPGEPGDDPAAPYHKEHVFATRIEKLFAEGLGVDWQAYEKEVDSL